MAGLDARLEGISGVGTARESVAVRRTDCHGACPPVPSSGLEVSIKSGQGLQGAQPRDEFEESERRFVTQANSWVDDMPHF